MLCVVRVAWRCAVLAAQGCPVPSVHYQWNVVTVFLRYGSFSMSSCESRHAAITEESSLQLQCQTPDFVPLCCCQRPWYPWAESFVRLDHWFNVRRHRRQSARASAVAEPIREDEMGGILCRIGTNLGRAVSSAATHPRCVFMCRCW